MTIIVLARSDFCGAGAGFCGEFGTLGFGTLGPVFRGAVFTFGPFFTFGLFFTVDTASEAEGGTVTSLTVLPPLEFCFKLQL